MKNQPLSLLKTGRIMPVFMLVFAVAMSTLLFQNAFAQQPQLSLADFLIGLRSKKATLPERNKILAEAAKARGVTFELTPEIEKELESTGADNDLIKAIKERSMMVKVSAVTPAKVEPTPAPIPESTPPPPDAAFYQKRGAANFIKGDLDVAIGDYNKAIEMNSSEPSYFLGRGLALYSKKSYEPAIADFDKVIELKPRDSMAYVNRAFCYEKLDQTQKALADFQKAVDLDPMNDSAKMNLKRIQDEQAKIQAALAALKPVVPTVPEVIPESIDVGTLSAAQAIRMAMPVYSAIAIRGGITGRVRVDITVDTDGQVLTAKAADGHPLLRQAAEDAAKRSKFKPVLYKNQPIKATGQIVYNFTRTPGQE